MKLLGTGTILGALFILQVGYGQIPTDIQVLQVTYGFVSAQIDVIPATATATPTATAKPAPTPTPTPRPVLDLWPPQPGLDLGSGNVSAWAWLDSAELITDTGREGDDKDDDTSMFVAVTTSDDRQDIAGISNAESHTPYHDGERHKLRLLISKPAEAKPAPASPPRDLARMVWGLHTPPADNYYFGPGDCNDFHVRIGIVAQGRWFGPFNGSITMKQFWDEPIISWGNGNDKWNFDACVYLYFSDGHYLENCKQNIELNSRGGKNAWTQF